MTYEPRPVDPERVRVLQGKARRFHEAYLCAKEAWGAAEQALLEEQCAGLDRYDVGDEILVPKNYFGRQTLVRARVVAVHLHHYEGTRGGEDYNYGHVSYAVFLWQPKEGCYGGSSEGFDHRQIAGRAPQEAQS